MAPSGWRGASARLVRGNSAVVNPENFRAEALALEQIEAYLSDIFGDLRDDAQQGDVLWAITQEYTEGRFTKRRSLDALSARTRRDYLGSGVAKREAAAHGLSVEAWYEVAPNVKAFRRQVRGPQEFRSLRFRGYVAASSQILPGKDQIRYSAKFTSLWAQRRRRAA